MKLRRNYGRHVTRQRKWLLVVKAAVVVVICIAFLALGHSLWEALDRTVSGTESNEQGANSVDASDSASDPVLEVQPVAVDFNMANLSQGWILYSDGSKLITTDGGEHWQPVSNEAAPEGEETLEMFLPADFRQLQSVTLGFEEYSVQRTQFVTDRVGWVLLYGDSDHSVESPLLVTVDGGESWHDTMTAEVKAVWQAEIELQQLMAAEAAVYASLEQAKQVIGAEWMLFPDASVPGDVVLVRHNAPGRVEWQGKHYELQPYGAGYFAYLPVALDVKPGEYKVGDATLTIEYKKFDVQYLEVTEDLNRMRQDTKRIQEDREKVTKARSQSAPEFLFTEAFAVPLEGRLTTPYGYTRYVNGKWDSSHQALDIAAPQGTPIIATNDGVVALAETLYLTGNAVYIDHGMELFSQYAHMSELKVKAGDQVKKGDVIGLVGSTGFSTGPHLHFAFWAHNVPVNPNLFFDTTPFQWLGEAGFP